MLRQKTDEVSLVAVIQNEPERIVAIRNAETGAHAVLSDRGLESVQIHPVPRMRWYFDRSHSKRIDNLKDSEICWALDRNDVIWTTNGAKAKIQCFHSTTRDDEFIR